MELFILIASFLGGWLLVTGPVYQAALELGQEQIDRAGFEAAAKAVPRPVPLSRWWWLLPPVAYLIHRSRDNAYREAVMHTLTTEQRTQMVGFMNKASAGYS